MKQSKLRKRRVFRYAALYFVMFVVALALLVGPIVAGTQILSGAKSLTDNPSGTMYLYQPIGLNNNDTRNRNETGTGAISGASSTASSSATAKVRLF
jgi:1,3-beta-glucan synthase